MHIREQFLDLYSTHRRLIAKSLPWFRVTLAVFVTGLLAGSGFYFIDPGLIDQIRDLLLARMGGDPSIGFSLAWEIFTSNTEALLVVSLGGIFLGFLPFFSTLLNGALLGYIIAAGLVLLSPKWVVFAAIVPHAVIEIPTFLLASALGLRFGLGWIKPPVGISRQSVAKKSFLDILQLLPIIIIALLIAALVEVYVSGTLLSLSNEGF